MKRLLIALVLLAAVACGKDDPLANGPEGTPLISDDVVNVQVGKAKIVAELATTPDQLSTGLMYRTELGRDRGMLFLLPGLRNDGFYMYNTKIPLTIAYLEHQGQARFEILDIVDMEPCPAAEPDDCPNYPAREDLYYNAALEMNRGWFGDANVQVGDEVEVLSRVG